MSTRAVYIFKNAEESYAVFKHHDGYPTGAAEAISKTLPLAWPLPRFEPDEFAASFVAANKECGGGIRLMEGSTLMHCSADIEYLYIIRDISNAGFNTAKITVTCYDTGFWDADTEEKRQAAMTELFTCPIDQLDAIAKASESKAA